MPTRHIVVDGSNLATEGRTTPSLVQLEEVVADLRREMQGAQVTVVVDATFRHRIDPSERERYDELVLSGDLVSPPAGAVGRGDAFLLRIAEKVDGIVLSNDSFQEFHGEHPWLFDRGRLMGASARRASVGSSCTGARCGARRTARRSPTRSARKRGRTRDRLGDERGGYAERAAEAEGEDEAAEQKCVPCGLSESGERSGDVHRLRL